MIKLSFLLSLFFIANTALLAQREISNPLINSKEIITKGIALHDAGKYKEAITTFLKVPASDTGYADVLHELILTAFSDSNFTDAEKYAGMAQDFYPARNTEWLGFLADIYDETKRSELALKAYDTILAQNPYSYLAYFNKGISFFRIAKMEEAEFNFKQCVILNPYYASAHHYLGRLALLKGNLVQAMMSFGTSLMVMPGNRYLKTTINYLSSIAEVNTNTAELLKKYKPGKEDDFEMIQEIIISKIALDKNYKLKADLEDGIVRQLQVMMEKLEYNANDKGFWMQYYVPMYKALWQHDQFEPVVNYIFSELEIKKVKEYVKKEKKKIESVTGEAVNYLNGIRETQELQFTKREKAGTRYYISNYTITGKGAYTKNAKNEDVVTGPWQFYFTNGRIKSEGGFDEAGLRRGLWKYYYENGIPKEATNYEKNTAQGKSESWFDNGLPYKKTNFRNDEKDGEETTWYYSGLLNSVVNYKLGKKEGYAKYYNIDDYLKTVTVYSNGLQQGEEIVYHPNGSIQSKQTYTNNVANGPYNEYFDNGKIKVTGNYTDGKKTGTWNTSYKNGNKEFLENYIKGELDGEYTSWYNNGKTATKRLYKKDDIDGKKEDFDDDGIIYSETIFEKGKLKDIKFFDKQGTVISNTSSRRGSAGISFYAPDGSKTSDGFYSKEGVLEGKGKNYFKNGKLSAEADYKNGLLDGSRITYYENGKLRQEEKYAANNANGYFTGYYINGEVSEEGWYVDGRREGTVISRDLLGNINSKIYYLGNNINGITENYYATGKMDYKAFYDNNWFNKLEQFDTAGKLLCSSALVKGEGKIFFKHFNGSPYIESNYKYYKLNGPYKITNGDGSKCNISYYKNGISDSLQTTWYPNGKIKEEGKYSNGYKTGAWKYYWFNGQLSTVENYEDGKLAGKSMQYNEDGSVDKELNYTNGEVNGEYSMYGDNKELAVLFYYKNGELTGYSYLDKTGKPVPMIALPKGSGKVIAYYKNGNKSAAMEFNESLVEGERILYSTTGKERIAGKRVNGLEHGSKKIYYPTGKLLKEENYLYGKLHGSDKYYSENGTLISDVNYYLGDLHGECKYYSNGKLTDTYIYYYGVMESKK